MKRTTLLFILATSLFFPANSTHVLQPFKNKPVFASTTTEKKITTKQESKYAGIVREVDNIAQQITIRIATTNNPAHGSGVIIARKGNTYYVATAKHVVKDKQQYQIITPDGVEHKLDETTIETSDTYDLGIFSFESSTDYQIATLGKYMVGTDREQVVFVTGFPKLDRNFLPQRTISGGRVIKKDERDGTAKESYSLQEGQELLYTNISYGGMSGGAVLDKEGRLIGIHTSTDGEFFIDDEDNYNNVNLGFSLGIPIRDALAFFYKTQLDISALALTSNPATEVKEAEWKYIESQLLTTTQPNSEEITAWMNHGNQLWRYERYDEAIKAFEEVITLNPNYHQAYYGMGLTYRSQAGKQFRQRELPSSRQSYQKAVSALVKATEINSNPYYYWRWLGFAYTELKQYDKALAAYGHAIENADTAKDFVLYQERGDVWSFAKKYPNAIADYTQAAKIKHNHPWIYSSRGIAYRKLKQYSRAIADFDKAITLNSFYSDPYNNRGIVYADLQQYKKAIADYTKAIDIDTNNAAAYYNRGIAYRELNQYERAISDFNKHITFNPQEAESYYNRGTLYVYLEKYDKAILDLTEAITIDPNNADAHFNRGVSYKILQQYDLAIADLDKAINLDSQSADIYFQRGSTYGELEQYDNAISDFSQAIKLQPQNTEIYLRRAFAHNGLEQYNKAIADFTKVIEFDSQNAFAYFNRGNIYGKTKQYDKAISDFGRVIAIKPENAQAYYLRSLTFYSSGNIRSARKDAQEAIQLYESQGNPQQAESVKQLLQKLSPQPVNP